MSQAPKVLSTAEKLLNSTDDEIEQEAMMQYENFCLRMMSKTLLHKEARESYGKLAQKVHAIRRLRGYEGA